MVPIGLTNLGGRKLWLLYCGNCGRDIPEGTKFCPSCGSPQTLSQSAIDVKRPIQTKPRNFALLIVFDILGGVFMMFIGLVSLDTLLGDLLAFAGFLSLIVALGFTLRKPWIWWPAILQAVVVLLLGGFFTLLTLYTSAILAIYSIPGILLGLWSLYLLRKGEIHSLFRAA
jgi:RNA polymerase subunit RPABC4/transcription elongation factor Spt4